MTKRLQIIIRDNGGTKDLTHLLELMERRLSILEAQVRSLIEYEECEPREEDDKE